MVLPRESLSPVKSWMRMKHFGTQKSSPLHGTLLGKMYVFLLFELKTLSEFFFFSYIVFEH